MDLKRHLSFANVAAGTALVIALGGGAAVAGGLAKNSVGSPQIKKNAVKSSDIKNNAVKGKDIKESTLGKVPSVESVTETKRVTAVVGAVPTTIFAAAPFTIALRCIDEGGGIIRSLLEIRTSQDDAAYDARLSGDQHPDFDVFDGPQSLGSAAGTSKDITEITFVALSPTGTMLQGFGYAGARVGGANLCSAQMTFLN